MPRVLPILVTLGALGGCTTTEPCNGHASLCELRLDQVTLPATHNSMSSADEGWIAPNQGPPPRQQLADGIRGMLLDTFWWRDEAYLCHGVCELGATPLADVLGEVRTFLDDNPRDVLVFVIQNGLDADRTETAFDDAGLLPRAIVPPARGEAWPTLGELADADTRLLITRESGDPVQDWYPSFYDIGFDTPYQNDSVDDFRCDVLRGEGPDGLFLLNHWIGSIPNPDASAQANRAEVLRDHASDCAATFGRPPTLLAVNHYETGELLAVVDELNGVVP